MTKIAISQSNYIPWKGFFDLIASVDIFILYDDMQYTRRDWRNRNKIKTEHGVKWLTIPVQVKGKFDQKINQTLIADPSWSSKHWNQLQVSYAAAEHFESVSTFLKPLYMNYTYRYLSEWNNLFIAAVCDYLDIKTEIKDSRDYNLQGSKTERLANLCQQLNATSYVSGPAAKDYLDKQVFSDMGIEVTWADFSNYPEYPQLHGSFEHSVTILDLLFNTGRQARSFMKSVA